MIKKVVLIAFILIYILIVSPVFARSGCCSWHGGVCGCGCCDGSPLSSTCAPYYPQCGGGGSYEYVPRIPDPTPIIIPEYIKGGPTFTYNSDTNSYNVTFNWDDWNQSSGWSVSLSSYAGADPGPLVDTTSSVWTFRNVYPGQKFVNVKAAVNGYWSRVSYWTIDVPPLPTPSSIPSITPIPTIAPSPHPTKVNKQGSVDKKTFLHWLFNIIVNRN